MNDLKLITLGINKILVTCYPDNKASEKVILAKGGVYEKTVVVDGTKIQRFWIGENDDQGN